MEELEIVGWRAPMMLCFQIFPLCKEDRRFGSEQVKIGVYERERECGMAITHSFEGCTRLKFTVGFRFNYGQIIDKVPCHLRERTIDPSFFPSSIIVLICGNTYLYKPIHS